MTAAAIRHEIDPAKVAASVAKKIAANENQREVCKRKATEAIEAYSRAVAAGRAANWGRPPEGPGFVDPMIDRWNAKERDHYARVRIIERPAGEKRFLLVYGDQPDDGSAGSGPFATLQDAENWFTNQGR